MPEAHRSSDSDAQERVAAICRVFELDQLVSQPREERLYEGDQPPAQDRRHRLPHWKKSPAAIFSIPRLRSRRQKARFLPPGPARRYARAGAATNENGPRGPFENSSHPVRPPWLPRCAPARGKKKKSPSGGFTVKLPWCTHLPDSPALPAASRGRMPHPLAAEARRGRAFERSILHLAKVACGAFADNAFGRGGKRRGLLPPAQWPDRLRFSGCSR